MPIFAYKAIDRSGNELKSTINSDTMANAKQLLRSQGVMLVEIKERKTSGGGKSAGSGGFSININLGKKVGVVDLALMTRQLSTLVKARIQIVEALSALIDQVDNDYLKVTLSEIRTAVNEGTSLAKAMKDHPDVFDNVYVNMVEAGEASGTLDVVLLRLADFTEAQVKLKNKIKGALTYPVVIACFGCVMLGIIFVKVIPQITKMFVSAKKELPLQTKVVMAISDFLQNYWMLCIIGVAASVWLIRRYLKTQSGIKNWHALQLKLPILGPMVKMINVSRFCSTLATLLNSSVPILASMNIVKNLIPNVYMKQAIEESRVAVSEGSSLCGPLISSGLFPSMVTHMIKLGEQSGELEPMLEIIADNYQDQVDNKLSGLTSILEPIMMVGMGGVVGFIVFSVIVPMMELNSIK